MIMSARTEPHRPYSHVLSENFLAAVRQAALMIRQGRDDWKPVIKLALDLEFPTDSGMKTYAEASFSEIVGMLLKGRTTICIHRSLSHGFELFAEDE